MAPTPARSTTASLQHLQRLTAALGDAVTIDEVARAALAAATRLEGVSRAALAVSQGAGRQLQFVSSDEGAITPTVVRWCLIDAYDDLPLTVAVRGGDGVFMPTLEDLGRRFPDITERQRALGTRSLAAVPLVRNEERLGGLLLSYDDERPFGDHDRDFLSAFAAQVTQAVRRGLAYQIERSASEQLQRSLMPHSLPELEGLALGCYYQPGGVNVDVGGDWYDVMELPDGSVLVSLGDVMGKGLPAAIVMSEVRAAMRAYAMLDPTPSVVLERLDALVRSFSVPEQIVTMLYGLVAPGRSAMRLSVAGHPAPLLIPPQGVPRVFTAELGPALGLGVGPWPESELELAPDTTVLFFSDGLVESRDVDLTRGVELLRQQVASIRPHRRNPRELCARLSQYVRPQDADDDVTILAAAVPSSVERTASMELPAETSAAGLARRFVSGQLTQWGVEDDLVAVAELCVSELVTNAVIHSGTEPEVTVRLDDSCALVLVHDRGNRGTVQAADEFDPTSISGRGLTLVDAMSTAWGAEHNADGTTVWFELALVSEQPEEPVLVHREVG